MSFNKTLSDILIGESSCLLFFCQLQNKVVLLFQHLDAALVFHNYFYCDQIKLLQVKLWGWCELSDAVSVCGMEMGAQLVFPG